MSQYFERALFHFQHARMDEAQNEVRRGLAEDPNDGRLHALLALALSDQEQWTEATEEARTAIHLAPDQAFSYYAMACVLSARNQLEKAGKAIRQAIRLDPYHAHFFATLASIEFQQRQWTETLQAAEQGLQIDAEHVGCRNMRTAALIKLGRKSEARASVDATLADDPEGETAHVNKGWLLLESNQHKEALEHFREALRANPLSESAKAGLIEALKARYLIYRLLLRYFLWMSKLSRQAQWGVIIGLYVGFRVLRSIARAQPALAPLVWPLLIAYMAFALLTWLSVPLFNLALRLNKYGRFALSRSQRVASNWVGSALVCALGCGVAAFVFSSAALAFAAAYFALLMIPLSGTFQCDQGWPRTVMGAYTGLLAAVGAAAILGMSFCLQFGSPCLLLFILGVVAFSWVGNAFSQVTPTR